MDMKLLPLFLIVFFVFGYMSKYILLLKLVLGLRFKKGEFELRDSEEIPTYLKDLFDVYEDRLTNLGFRFSHCQLIDSALLPRFKKWHKVYYNAEEHCYGSASISEEPDRNFPVKLEFVTFFDDGCKLITLNGSEHELIGKFPNVILEDRYAATLEDQFRAHIEKQARLGDKRIITKGAGEYLKNEEEAIVDYFQNLENGGYVTVENGCYKLRFLAGLRYGFKMLKGMKKIKVMRDNIAKLSKKESLPTVEVPIDVEVEAFNRTDDVLSCRKSSMAGNLTALLVSVLLFMFTFRIVFSIDLVLAIVGVLFIHELGHFLGMLLFKYKDVQILFIPFLGAATMGNKQDVAVWKEVIVFLLGPAPGIFIGTCCLLIGNAMQFERVSLFGVFLLFFNYINLLPIMPLDGGRVFELVLFSRHLFLKSVFIILSFAAFFLFAAYTSNPIMLIFSFMMLGSVCLSVSHNRDCAKLRKKIKSENVELTKEKIVPEIFMMFKDSRFRKLAFGQKYNVVKKLLDGVMVKPPGVGVSVISLVFYFFVFLMPLFVALFYFLHMFFFYAGANV